MSDTDDDDVICALMSAVSATTLIALVTDADATKGKRRRKRKHRVWVMKYLRRRECYGAYNSLMRDLLSLDNMKFTNYVRMCPDDFEELFLKVQPVITSKDTKFRYIRNCY